MLKITFKREWWRKLIPTKTFLMISGIFIVIISLISSSAYFFVQYKNLQAKDPNYEITQIEKAVGKLMELPEGEVTLATVTNEEQLHEQGLFGEARNGDKILVYQEAGKVIVFRPSTKKIIIIENITTQNEQELEDQEQALAEAQSKPLAVVILNGTTTVGLTKDAQDYIASELEKVEVADTGNSKSKAYAETLVVYKGKPTAEVIALAYAFSAQIVESVENENVADGKTTLILGEDYALEQYPPVVAAESSDGSEE